MKWFGKAYGAAYEADTPHAETPVGELCQWCAEPVLEGDSGLLVPYMRKGPGLPRVAEAPYHYECHMRSVLGGINHQRGRCTCCGGDQPPDPPELSIREAACLAYAHWQVNRALMRHEEDTNRGGLH